MNAKGGVSKTLSTLNLATELSRRAGRVLMVDFDPQSSLTQTLGIHEEEQNIAEVLGVTTKGNLEIAPIILPHQPTIWIWRRRTSCSAVRK